MDKPWWQRHAKEAMDTFAGELISTCRFPGVAWARDLNHFNNSGASCISLALSRGAERVLLLAFDCQRTGGKVHWHGDHPKGIGNAGSMPDWPARFAKLRKTYPQADIINCSRATALTMFPRRPLEECLAQAPT